jgi:hypothetical protein
MIGPASIKGRFVFEAFESQLTQKNFPPPHDDTWKMDKDYGYNTGTMRTMLTAISGYLHKNGFELNVTEKLIIDGTTATLGDLRTTVTDQTT